jgi:hypothetical protein
MLFDDNMTEEIEDFGDICDKCEVLTACLFNEQEYCLHDGHYCKNDYHEITDEAELEKIREEIKRFNEDPDPW